MARPGSPGAVTFRPGLPGTGTGQHGYFDSLTTRPDCHVSYTLRNQAQLDTLETLKSGVGAAGKMRFPVRYDPAVDAALFRIDPRVGSTDCEHKRVNIGVASGSLLLTWDLRFDGGHQWRAESDLARHKTYQIGWKAPRSGDNRWLVFKTDYRNARSTPGFVAELSLGAQQASWLGPGTTLGAQEILQPRLATFFLRPDTWTRVWFFLEEIGRSLSFVSLWMADAQRDPVQLYDRLAVITPPGGIAKLWFEYDTSQDEATNAAEMRSWNRNVVVLKDPDLTDLLKKPGLE